MSIGLAAAEGAERRRVALVTGASRGIGRAIALSLAREGFAVIANWARSREAVESLNEEITARGGVCVPVQANVGSAAGRARLVESVRTAGRLDVLVHSAALGVFKPTLKLRPNQWSLTLSIGVHALVELCAALSGELATARGSVISISSAGSERVIPNYGVLGISKAALEAATRYLAFELGPEGVRVNTVRAGFVDTEGVRKLPGLSVAREHVRERVPLGRLATPDDIADAVRLLLRPEAGWITGQTIVADGGEGLL